MTYTLVFRVTREVWDALERGEKRVEYRDSTPFWGQRIGKAGTYLRLRAAHRDGAGAPIPVYVKEVLALFLGPPQTSGEPWRKARYAVKSVVPTRRASIPEHWQSYLTTPEVWAVELGERIA